MEKMVIACSFLLLNIPIHAMMGAVLDEIKATMLTKEEELLQATELGHIDAVKAALQKSPDLRKGDMVGNTALHLASLKGYPCVVRELLLYAKRHAITGNVEAAPNPDIEEHLCYEERKKQNGAAAKNFIESRGGGELLATLGEAFVMALTSQDQPAPVGPTRTFINFINKHGATAFHAAVIGGHLQTVQLLLAQGAEIYPFAQVDERYGNGYYTGTAFSIACLLNHTAIAKLLFERGAYTNTYGGPVHYAVKNGNEELVRLMLPRLHKELDPIPIVIHVKDDKGKTPLHHAVILGNEPLTLLLLSNDWLLKWTLFAKDNEGRLPIHYAALHGNIQLARLLVQKMRTYDWNSSFLVDHYEDNTSKTPVTYAEENEHFHLAAYLLMNSYEDTSKGPFVETQKKLTALHFAAMSGDCSLVREVKRKGASLTSTDSKGWMPVHYAAHYGRVEVVAFFLNLNDSFLFEFTSSSEPVLCVAAHAGQTEVVELLLTQKYKKGNIAIHYDRPLFANKPRMVLWSLDNEPDFTSKENENTLFYAKALATGATMEEFQLYMLNKRVKKTFPLFLDFSLIKAASTTRKVQYAINEMCDAAEGATTLKEAMENGADLAMKLLSGEPTGTVLDTILSEWSALATKMSAASNKLDRPFEDFSIPTYSFMQWALEERLPYAIDLFLKHGACPTLEVAIVNNQWKVLQEQTRQCQFNRYPYLLDAEGASALHYVALEKHRALFNILLQSVIAFELLKEAKQHFEEVFEVNPDSHPTSESWSQLKKKLPRNLNELSDEEIWKIMSAICWLDIETSTDIISHVRSAFEKRIFNLLKLFSVFKKERFLTVVAAKVTPLVTEYVALQDSDGRTAASIALEMSQTNRQWAEEASRYATHENQETAYKYRKLKEKFLKDAREYAELSGEFSEDTIDCKAIVQSLLQAD